MTNCNSILAIAVGLLALQGALAADRLTCDFTYGIPADWVLIDNDGNTPSNSAKKFGFDVGVAWVCTTDDDKNAVASSTSWYSPSGTSDDWMILSPVEITDETTLSWRARAVDSKYRDGYAVYISTTGNTLDDFAGLDPIFEVGEEEATWATHSLSLADYAGSETWVAFVNNSTNKSRLFVDDIAIMAPKPLVLELATDVVTTPGMPVTIKGTVSSDTGLEGPVKIIASYGDTAQEIDADFGDFEFPESILLSEPCDLPVAITATVGEASLSEEFTLRARTRYHVAEEFTGTWCGYCVRGLVAMEHMKATYTDDYIGIAVHNGDVMAIDHYSEYMSTLTGQSGYPAATVDRTYGCDPRDIEENYLKALDEQNVTVGALDVVADFDNDTHEIHADVKVWFNITDAQNEYRLIYIVTEDDVYHPGEASYFQHNSYADGFYGEMGGFENLPEYVDGIHFQEVARYVSESALGISGSLPLVEAYKEYDHSWSFQLPDMVDDPANCRLVVMLLGKSGKQVLNAVPIQLTDIGAISGIASVASDSPVVSRAYYDLQGRRIDNPSGLVIELTTHADGTISSQKLHLK